MSSIENGVVGTSWPPRQSEGSVDIPDLLWGIFDGITGQIAINIANTTKNALGGIDALGLLRQWGNQQEVAAQNALNAATAASTQAATAQTGVQQVTDGISAGVGNTGTGHPTSTVSSNIGSINQTAQSVGSQVNSIVQALAQPGYPLWWTAGDSSAEVTFPFELLSALSAHSHGLSGYADGQYVSVSGSTSDGQSFNGGGQANNAAIHGSTTSAGIPYLSVGNYGAFIGFIRFQTAAQRDSISFLAQINPANNTTFNLYVDVYQLNTDGSATLVQSTPDVSGQINTSNYSWVSTTLTSPLTVTAGSVFGFQLRVVGAAVINVPGLSGFIPTNHIGARPYSNGATWNPNGNTSTAVTTITQPNLDAMYSATTPFISVGTQAIPQQLYWYDDFNRSSLGSAYYLVNSDGGANAYIYQGALGYQGYSDGVQAIIYYEPAFTDKIGISFNIPSNAGATATPAGAGLGCDPNGNGGVWLSIWTYNGTGGVYLNAGPFSNQLTSNASPYAVFPLPANTQGNWSLSYNRATNTYTVTYPDSSTQTWVDQKNQVTHGSPYRYGALFVSHQNFTVATVEDNFSFYDM